ncbi:MAG: tripartite tricarboxylate transporter substrate binding protein [Candidatus Protistobacter heckmanni]|nr:tripartite tricarboxylate transporter substrate binding protein [Candidatus Protistobacter heckmanni]
MRPAFPRRALLALGACAALFPLSSIPSFGQARVADVFPSKPVRIVVPFAAGGPTDLMARVIAKSMSAGLSQPVVVENKPGGGGVIGLSDVARSPADGYSLAFPSILSVTNQYLLRGYPFDMARDFTPLTVVGYIPHVLIVRNDLPIANLQEYVTYAKAQLDMTFASSGLGTSTHLAGELLSAAAGVHMRHVPYRGAAMAVQDLIGGQTHSMFLDTALALPLIKAGKVRAIAVASRTRLASLPGVPTIAESGYPSFGIRAWYGLMLRKDVPAPIVDRLYEEVRRALASPEVREVFLSNGIEPGGMPPAAFAKIVKEDSEMWRDTIARLKISVD